MTLPKRQGPPIQSTHDSYIHYAVSSAREPDQVALVAGVRALLNEWGRNFTPKILLKTSRDVFPPPAIFHPNILITPEYYAKLRNVFEEYDVDVPDLPDDHQMNPCRIARPLH